MAGRGSLPHTQLPQTSKTTPRGKGAFSPWPPYCQQQPGSQSVPSAKGVPGSLKSEHLSLAWSYSSFSFSSTGCYWQLLLRMHRMSLLVSAYGSFMQLPFLAIPLVTIPCHLPVLSSLTSSLALWLLHSEFFVPFTFQLALFLSSSAAFPVEYQQSSKDFLGFK